MKNVNMHCMWKEVECINSFYLNSNIDAFTIYIAGHYLTSPIPILPYCKYKMHSDNFNF